VALLVVAQVAVAVLTLQASPHTVVCFVDLDGSGGFDAGDPLYLSINACGASSIGVGDARLTAGGGFSGGSIVWGSDPDASRSTGPVGAAGYAYYDADGTTTYTAGDTALLHFGAQPGQIAVGDVPLNGSGAFQAVGAGDSGLNRPLRAFAVPVGGESFADLDGDGAYGVGDAVYLDTDASGSVTNLDVRVAAGHQPGSPPPTPPATPPVTPPGPTGVPSPPPQPPATPPVAPPATPMPTPQSPSHTAGATRAGPAASAPAALLLALLAARRKSPMRS
jgi:hypothetical protein